MCGIAGVIGGGAADDRRARVARMMAKLAHRGPDGQGTFEAPAQPACLGHTRLAILDLSDSGAQPMLDGANALVLNGEIYNYIELRDELQRAGLPFRSTSDTEVLLRGYGHWGDGVVDRLRGMFAFALWDGTRQRLLCARDPFGKKPLYCHHQAGRFTFASEVEALIAGLDTRPQPDAESLASYLLKGYSAPGRSIYSSIGTLGAGQCVAIDARTGDSRRWTYHQLRFNLGQQPIGFESATTEALPRIQHAVDIRLRSDVPVGILLSGGVDSSLVSLLSPSSLRAFTVTFDAANDEREYAQAAADAAGQTLEQVDVPTIRLPKAVEQVAACYGEPFGDPSAIPSMRIFQSLSSSVKVALTGDGGDEVFAGYADTRLYWARSLFGERSQTTTGHQMQTSLVGSRWRAARLVGYGLGAMGLAGGELFVGLHREGWTDHWRREFMRPAARRLTGEDQIERQMRAEFASAGDTDLERYLNRSLERLTEGFLVKIDRASMAHAVEARSPMLDLGVFDFASRLPADVLMRRGRPKAVPKRLVADRLGRRFATRMKQGFTPPLAAWLRDGGHSAWIERRLTSADSYCHELFTPSAVSQLLTLHRDGQDQSGRIWRLLILDEWHRRAYGRAQAADTPQPVETAIT